MKPGKRTRKRFVAVFFLLGLMLCCASAEAAVTYYLENGALTVKQASPDVTITGTYDANTYPNTAVTVENGYQGTITLDGVSIDLDLVRTRGPMPILLAAGASPDILLSGDNRLRGGWYAAGLGVPAGAKVRISGPGSLAATGGKTFGGAGIGGIEGSGAVTITGGTVTATSAWGAGIGGGSGSNSTRGGDGGTVTITGGTVTATGGAASGGLAAGAGIGGGGAGIGGTGGSGGTVTITGGMVTATGGAGSSGLGAGAGIGGTGLDGIDGNGAAVTISGGIVTATGGAGGAGGGGQDIGVGAGDLGGEPGTTVITGGSVNARAGKVDNPTYDKANAVAPDSEFPRTYESGSEGWTISFTVNVAPPNTYTYTFTIPQDRKAYLWLPSGKSPPTPYDVKNLTLPKLTLTPQFASGKCVVGLGVSSGTLQAWQRLDPGSVTPVPGTGTPDNNDGNGFASPGKYTYRASTGTAALSIWSDPATETLKAPAISGPASMTLTTGYAATSTDVYTITGNPTPNVTATGDPKIVWDGGTEKLKIAAGLAAGTYPVILTAVNGLTPAATFTFTLTVKTPAPGPGPDPTPPSSDTKPSNMKITIGGESEPLAQTGTTFSATVPYGTDVSSVDITGNLPPGAKSEPKLPAKHDFNTGPFTITVTAENGTKVTYTINVIVLGPDQPTEKQYFTFNVNDCEVVAEENADGSWLIKIRLPFAGGADPALLSAVKAFMTNLGLMDLYYSWVDAQGNATPVAALAVKAPYLEISGTAANRDTFKNGTITSIQYTLEGDDTTYVQTFANGGIKLADMPGFPQESPSGGGSSSSCDAGFGAVAAMMLAGAAIGRRRS